MDPVPVERLKARELAEEATFLAAERTLFSVLSTGLAVAAGGALVTTLLGDDWPTWVQLPLVGVFLFVGYTMTLMGLRRYRGIVQMAESHGTSKRRMMSLQVLSVGIVLLEIAIVVVVVLFVVGAFQPSDTESTSEPAPSTSATPGASPTTAASPTPATSPTG